MKNILSLILVGLLFSCGTAPAFAKGFSTSYGSRSSSYSTSRSYSAPRPAPTVTKNVTVNKTTVVHEHYNNGGSGNGMLTGLLLGEAISNHNQQPVVIQQPVMAAPVPQVVEQAPIAPVVQQPVVVQHEEESSHWFLWSLVLVLVCGSFVYLVNNKTQNKG